MQKFTTYNTDVRRYPDGTNPRSQLVTPETVLKHGNAYWQSYRFYIPKSFTLVPGAGWVSLETGAFGYPYAGSPPLELSIENGDFRFQRNGFAPTPWQIAWGHPGCEGPVVSIHLALPVLSNRLGRALRQRCSAEAEVGHDHAVRPDADVADR